MIQQMSFKRREERLEVIVPSVGGSQVKWGSPPHVGLVLPARPPGESPVVSVSAWRKPNGGRNRTGGAKRSAPPFVAQWGYIAFTDRE